MKALGTIIEAKIGELLENEIWSGLLDYYDHWESIDDRLAAHHDALSKWSEAFGHDLVNMATYSDVILTWLDSRNRTWTDWSVVRQKLSLSPCVQPVMQWAVPWVMWQPIRLVRLQPTVLEP